MQRPLLEQVHRPEIQYHSCIVKAFANMIVRIEALFTLHVDRFALDYSRARTRDFRTGLITKSGQGGLKPPKLGD